MGTSRIAKLQSKFANGELIETFSVDVPRRNLGAMQAEGMNHDLVSNRSS